MRGSTTSVFERAERYLGIAFFGAVIFCGAFLLGNPREKALQDWHLGQFLVNEREAYNEDLKLAENVDGYEEWGKERFIEYAVRRRNAIGYAERFPVKIIFVGFYHDDSFWEADPSTSSFVDESKRFALESVGRYSAETDILLMEAAMPSMNAGDRLTRDLYIAGVREAARLSGEGITERELQTQILPRSGLQLAVFDQHPDLRVAIGEDWAYRFQLSLLLYAANQYGHRDPMDVWHQIHYDLMTAFYYLRSELVLITAIEQLQRLDGDQAVLLMSAGHGYHLTELKEFYEIDLVTVMPDLGEVTLDAALNVE